MSLTLKVKWHDNRTLFDITYMQEMNPDICENTTTPVVSTTTTTNVFSTNTNLIPEKSLKDIRDNKYYIVRKHHDGNCWMDQNLDLDLSTDTPLTSADTDIGYGTYQQSETDTTSELSKTTTNRTSWTPNISTWPKHANDTTAQDAYKWTNSDANHAYSYDQGDVDITGNATASITSQGNINHIGNIYNDAAGFAFSNRSSASGTLLAINNYGIIPDSICPKGWRIPMIGINPNWDTYGHRGDIVYDHDKTFHKLWGYSTWWVTDDGKLDGQTVYPFNNSNYKANNANFGSFRGGGTYHYSQGRVLDRGQFYGKTSTKYANNTAAFKASAYYLGERDGRVMYHSGSSISGGTIRCVNR